MPWIPGRIVRVFTTERAHIAHVRVIDALVRFVQEEHLAGVTVTRATESAPANGAHHAPDMGAPVVVEVIDRAERIEQALPRIAALVGAGTLTVTDARVYLPASHLRVRDIAESAHTIARPETPLTDALSALLDTQHSDTRLIPVVDTREVVVGVLTLGHLLEHMDSDLATHLMALRDPARIREHIMRHAQGRTVSEVMRAPALTLAQDTTFDSAARFFATHHLTRAPVIDADGHLAGLLSEHALVAALTAPLLSSLANGLLSESASDRLSQSGEWRVALRASVAPGGAPLTAGALTDRLAPQIVETAPWREVARAIESAPDGAPARLALVVDESGALRGVIDERDVLREAVGSGASGALAVFRRMFGARLDESVALSEHVTPRRHAGELARPAIPTVSPDTPIATALAQIVNANNALFAIVVAPDGRPEGVLWRSDALHALVGL